MKMKVITQMHSEVVTKSKEDTWEVRAYRTPLGVVSEPLYLEEFSSVLPQYYISKIEKMMEEEFLTYTLLRSKPLKALKLLLIQPLIQISKKIPRWISLKLDHLLNSEITNLAERSRFICGILDKLMEDSSITEHTKIEITAGRPSEDIEEDYLTLIINIDGTPQSIEAYKKIISEFYRDPKNLKNVMIFFKVTPRT